MERFKIIYLSKTFKKFPIMLCGYGPRLVTMMIFILLTNLIYVTHIHTLFRSALIIS